MPKDLVANVKKMETNVESHEKVRLGFVGCAEKRKSQLPDRSTPFISAVTSQL